MAPGLELETANVKTVVMRLILLRGLVAHHLHLLQRGHGVPR
eukprot:CAMPEP_0185196524 /NCGR_PEP_ID=MMETSP1140-20130426/37755_1 /TAXON_ID=298111 /ORGANISM="Pavlova sp., Strain CCMP459" /LENGTH=41 /DNA_ID= /DNA_START= /DNA_END= /DNA_ORIENTATION=